MTMTTTKDHQLSIDPMGLPDVVDASEIVEHYDNLDASDAYDRDEIATLDPVIGELRRAAEHNATLVRASIFTEHVQSIAEDLLGQQHYVWPLTHMDWETCAEEYKHDFESILINGFEYLYSI